MFFDKALWFDDRSEERRVGKECISRYPNYKAYSIKTLLAISSSDFSDLKEKNATPNSLNERSP